MDIADASTPAIDDGAPPPPPPPPPSPARSTPPEPPALGRPAWGFTFDGTIRSLFTTNVRIILVGLGGLLVVMLLMRLAQVLGLVGLLALVALFPPYAIVSVERWRTAHIRVNGNRLVFTGTPQALFGSWVLWVLLTVVTLGIYGLWVPSRVQRWTWRNRKFADPGIKAEFSFEGGAASFIGTFIVAVLVLVVSNLVFGLLNAFASKLFVKWTIENTRVAGRRLRFGGTATTLLGTSVLFSILTWVATVATVVLTFVLPGIGTFIGLAGLVVAGLAWSVQIEKWTWDNVAFDHEEFLADAAAAQMAGVDARVAGHGPIPLASRPADVGAEPATPGSPLATQGHDAPEQGKAAETVSKAAQAAGEFFRTQARPGLEKAARGVRTRWAALGERFGTRKVVTLAAAGVGAVVVLAVGVPLLVGALTTSPSEAYRQMYDDARAQVAETVKAHNAGQAAATKADRTAADAVLATFQEAMRSGDADTLATIVTPPVRARIDDLVSSGAAEAWAGVPLTFTADTSVVGGEEVREPEVVGVIDGRRISPSDARWLDEAKIDAADITMTIAGSTPVDEWDPAAAAATTDDVAIMADGSQVATLVRHDDGWLVDTYVPDAAGDSSDCLFTYVYMPDGSRGATGIKVGSATLASLYAEVAFWGDVENPGVALLIGDYVVTLPDGSTSTEDLTTFVPEVGMADGVGEQVARYMEGMAESTASQNNWHGDDSSWDGMVTVYQRELPRVWGASSSTNHRVIAFDGSDVAVRYLDENYRRAEITLSGKDGAPVLTYLVDSEVNGLNAEYTKATVTATVVLDDDGELTDIEAVSWAESTMTPR